MKRQLEKAYFVNVENNYLYKIILIEPLLLINILKYFNLSEIVYFFRLIFFEIKKDDINLILENFINNNFYNENFKIYNSKLLINFIQKFQSNSEDLNEINNDFNEKLLIYNTYCSLMNIIYFGFCQMCNSIPKDFCVKMIFKIFNNNKNELESEMMIICFDCQNKYGYKNIWIKGSEMKKLTNLYFNQEISSDFFAKHYNIRTLEINGKYQYFKKDIDERIILIQIDNKIIELKNKMNEIKKNKF